MAGTKIFNTDIDVLGSIKLSDTPNNTGNILTKSSGGIISERTPNQILGDIGAIQTLSLDDLSDLSISGGNTVALHSLRARVIDWEEAIDLSRGFFNTTHTGGPAGTTAVHGIVVPHGGSGEYGTSLVFRNNRGWIRSLENGVLNPWVELWHTGNLPQSSINNWNTAYGWGNHANKYVGTGQENSSRIGTYVGDLDLIKKDGVYTSFISTTSSNTPFSNAGGFINIGLNSGITSQLLISRDGDNIGFRGSADGATLTPWRVVWHTGNLTESSINNWNRAFGWGDFRDFGLGTIPPIISDKDEMDFVPRRNSFIRAANAGSNGTWSAYGAGIHLTYADDRHFQIWGSVASDILQFRRYINSSWSEARTVWHDGNLRSDTQNDQRYLQLSGGTVTGVIKSPAPVADADLANKKYVDDEINSVESPFEIVDVTQGIYTNKAIVTKVFDNPSRGMEYSEGAIDFGLSIGDIYQMGMYSFKQGVNTVSSGLFSAAFGQETEASGNGSVAFGGQTKAQGAASVAFGNFTQALEETSAAFGYNTTASGMRATAFGSNTTASGLASVAFGQTSIAEGRASASFGSSKALGELSVAFGGSTASGVASVSFGTRTESSGDYSISFGNASKAEGEFSIASGIVSRAIGRASSAIGNSNVASGYYSTALGELTVSNNYASLVIGRYTTEGDVETFWVDGSPIFKVGNGSNGQNRKDAYVLYNDGKSKQEGIAEYMSNLHSQYTNRTLVDKEYVDNYSSIVKETRTLEDLGGNAFVYYILEYPEGYYLMPQGGNISVGGNAGIMISPADIGYAVNEDSITVQYGGTSGAYIGRDLTIYFLKIKK